MSPNIVSPEHREKETLSMDMTHLLETRQRVLEGIKATDTVTSLLAGMLAPRVYARYLTNVWHYAQHSAIIIGTAGARCVTDNPALALYLLHHAREELGHDQWALDDLAAMGIDEDAVRASRPTPTCAAIVGVEYYTDMHANPFGLFGWVYALEAMGDNSASSSRTAYRAAWASPAASSSSPATTRRTPSMLST
jgi:hypothetical protein